MSELTKRVLFALIAGPLFLWLTWLGHWYFHILILFIGLFIVDEMGDMASKAGYPSNKFLSYLICGWIIMFPILPGAMLWGLVLLMALMIIETFNKEHESVKHIFGTFFSSIYAPVALLCMVEIRNLSLNMYGFSLILALMLSVWGNDVFAYFGGRFFGKHLLAPHISPKKTWEGFFAGFAGTAAGLAITWFVMGIYYPLDIYTTVVLGIIISLFGPVGDLIESKIKRFVDVKDSGWILPGHGGVFDRFDAVLLNALAMFVFLQLWK